MHETPRARLVVYSVAVLATAVALLVRWPLWPVLGNAVPHMTFFPAVMIAAYFGGFWPGLLATLLSAIAANYFFTQQLSSFHITSVNDVVGLTLFVLVGAILSGLCESLHRARRRIVAHERLRAEEAVRETEARFRQLAENIHEIFWVWDVREDRVLYISPGYEEVWGRTCQSLYEQPRSWVESVHPDDRSRVIQDMEQQRRGVFADGEFRVVRPDGSVRWIRRRAFPINDQAGNVARIAGLAEDITERKQIEQSLQESESRLHRMLDSLPAAAYTCDADGLITYFNERARALWGRSPKLNHRDDRYCGSFKIFETDGKALPHDQCGMAVAIKEEREIKGIEVLVERADGGRRNVLAHVNPMWDSQGRLVGAANVVVDITDRKRAEEALRESERRFRTFVDHATDAFFLQDERGAILDVNRQACESLGYTRDELLGMTPTDFDADVTPADLAEVERKLSIGETITFESRHRRKDGAVFPVEMRCQAFWEGGRRFAVALVRDITDRKQTEEALRKAKEVAEAANRAKDEFLANVSHEIRTPMNAILGMTELALDTPLTDDQRQCLRTVKSAADNLLGIINDLLDFSKIEAGKLELDPAELSLRAALGDTMRALAVRAHKKGLELVCHVQPDVPDALVGDAGRLRQILLNLVGNAIKFTDEGEVVVTVQGARDEGRGAREEGPDGSDGYSFSSLAPRPSSLVPLVFEVRDTGIGVPHNRQASIFRAFEQEDTSTTRKYGGTGLGLTIAARLVALMGGQITVASEPGRGSTFAFTARFGRPTHSPEPAAAPPPVLLHNLPVLLVDDNATNRHILQEWLRGWQMEPVAVGDGLSALNALWGGAASGRPYALVLLDARMPDTDGLTLAAMIRERAELSATRIILLTSGDRAADLARSREQRVNAHLLKPVQQDELYETIYRVMSRANGNVPSSDGLSRGPEPVPASVPAAAPLRILVAEDNEFNAQLLEQLLVRRGHRVRLAKNGREALFLAERGAFDLLLLDVHMPELDGFQVVQAVRAREQAAGGHLPIIALTARSQKEDRERCLAAGMDDFLAKPIQAANLWAAINQVVGACPPADRPGRGLLDPRVLLAASGGDAVILEKICQAFRAHLPDHLTAVQAALRERDTGRLREAAHKLCGMVAAFSTVAGGVASDLEDRAAQGQLEEARPLVGQLETMADELVRRTSGLSLETLRQQTGTADDPNRTASL